MPTTPATFNPLAIWFAYLHMHWPLIGPMLAVVAYLFLEAILKSTTRFKANSPVEALANIVVALLPQWFPVVARVARALATPGVPTVSDSAADIAKKAGAAIVLLITLSAQAGCGSATLSQVTNDKRILIGLALFGLVLCLAVVYRAIRRNEMLSWLPWVGLGALLTAGAASAQVAPGAPPPMTGASVATKNEALPLLAGPRMGDGARRPSGCLGALPVAQPDTPARTAMASDCSTESAQRQVIVANAEPSRVTPIDVGARRLAPPASAPTTSASPAPPPAATDTKPLCPPIMQTRDDRAFWTALAGSLGATLTAAIGTIVDHYTATPSVQMASPTGM